MMMSVFPGSFSCFFVSWILSGSFPVQLPANSMTTQEEKTDSVRALFVCLVLVLQDIS